MVDTTGVVSTLDLMLAYYAAPTILGVKPASLFWCTNSDRINNQIDYFNKAAEEKEVAILRINGRRKHSGLLVYHQTLLDRYLKDTNCIAFLKQFGYSRFLTLGEKLSNLKTRLETYAEFPHEIGIFLGYPIKDVEGFIENKGQNYILRGCWLVYSDAENACRIFSQYRLCRYVMVNKVINGTSIYNLLHIGTIQ